MLSAYRDSDSHVPEDCFVIGQDATSTPSILLFWRGKHQNEVWLKDYEQETRNSGAGGAKDETYFLAKSFGDFLKMLGPLNEDLL